MKRTTKEITNPESILHTGIQCPSCGEIVVSLHVHDWRQCGCKEVFIDGGQEYIRVGWNSDRHPEPPLTVKVRLSNSRYRLDLDEYGDPKPRKKPGRSTFRGKKSKKS